MSFSIDDLASSLSASHIGQEALDLAALQAQLAQTLFGQSITHSSKPQNISRKTSFAQPCNTPTFSSFSSNFSNDMHSISASSQDWMLDSSRDYTMEEDERMVEALLIPCSPMSTSLTHPTAGQFDMISSEATTNQAHETPASSFTCTDPFYLEQSQTQFLSPAPYSVFTQLGEASQQSPFLSSPRREHPGMSHSAPLFCMDSFLVATSGVFEH
ncbi:hypothetical protein H0H81_011647 [Sphagnurus paluster]|uniref:Uncharacterized protein n=1 Tax=Sphagnurus paluster TaxID=117069 RepID=A0A9P7FQW3_9AGAR|nr:hypothetical protein H0H81_011647 [Sphagnurus paluster]